MIFFFVVLAIVLTVVGMRLVGLVLERYENDRYKRAYMENRQ